MSWLFLATGQSLLLRRMPNPGECQTIDISKEPVSPSEHGRPVGHEIFNILSSTRPTCRPLRRGKVKVKKEERRLLGRRSPTPFSHLPTLLSSPIIPSLLCSSFPLYSSPCAHRPVLSSSQFAPPALPRLFSSCSRCPKQQQPVGASP